MDADFSPAFHIMAKPIGPACNLNCTYCYYIEKQALFGHKKKNFRMSGRVLEEFIKKYITTQDIPEIAFTWQGGEPTLLGIDFFKTVVSLQKKYAGGKTVTNAIQTNGTLLTNEWCAFFAENRFLVGLSIDGPEEVHDQYRVDKAGRGTFKKVLTALQLLRKHRVDVNALACITRKSAGRPLDVYRFLKEVGIQFIQFIPIVERVPDEEARRLGLHLAMPPAGSQGAHHAETTPWSVEPEGFGDFLIRVFDQWVRNDVGAVHVMNFEALLGAWMGLDAATCVYAKECGQSLVMEHNGDIYACDHFVYPEHRLGNILEDMPRALIKASMQAGFGSRKHSTLPRACRNCDVLFACRGECPKHRFCKTEEGEPGLNYLCRGYKKFLTHIDKYMKTMAVLIQNGYPASRIMDAIKDPIALYAKSQTGASK